MRLASNNLSARQPVNSSTKNIINMTTEVKQEGSKTIIYFKGEMDTLASSEAEQTLQPVLETKPSEIILDCTSLEYIASAGLRLFISLLKSVKSSGGNLVVKNINEDIQDVFKVTGFDSLFTIE